MGCDQKVVRPDRRSFLSQPVMFVATGHGGGHRSVPLLQAMHGLQYKGGGRSTRLRSFSCLATHECRTRVRQGRRWRCRSLPPAHRLFSRSFGGWCLIRDMQVFVSNIHRIITMFALPVPDPRCVRENRLKNVYRFQSRFSMCAAWVSIQAFPLSARYRPLRS